MNKNKIKSLTARKKNSHKSQHGHVLIIGGSEDYTGTLILAGLAALRSGCDIVTIAAPEKVAWAINCYSPDLITKKLPGKYLAPSHIPLLTPLLEKATVIALGNGIGLRKETKQFCKKLMSLTKDKPKVIDADAIKLLSLKDITSAIITPHAVELHLLLNNSNLAKFNKIKNKIRKSKAIQPHLTTNILLMKGPTDFIISKTRMIKVMGGNPGMARAGMGDVLAGLCAGFLSPRRIIPQKNNLIQSAEAASTLNKTVGDILFKKKNGYSFIASDMVEEIKKIKNKIRRKE